GYYTEEELIVGGDADSATNNIIGSESTNVTISTEANNGGSASFKGTRMDQKRWAWVNGEKYLVTWDAKSASDADVTVTMNGTGNITHMVPGTGYTRAFTATSDWNSYQMYVVMVANKGSDYLSLRASATAYFDNYSVKRLTKAGKVPVFYNINVTETNDFGIL
ncbi:MAG: hypothetical protein IJ936_04850, partial [Peptococcaceae bacterium]|nr:hypothetical protein [Peptococcaceae bacterium]